jgi:uncharacterized protein YndB with AHSA1/START domain
MKNEPFVIERRFNAPVEKVWKAISDKDEMKQWYFDLSAFKPEKGFEFSFEGGSEKQKYTHLCKVLEATENKKLSYSWRYKDYQGNSIVTFELFPEEGGTRVKLTHEGLESFPDNNPDFAKESFQAGWTYIIGESLKKYLER